jgi:hypothetical protein
MFIDVRMCDCIICMKENANKVKSFLIANGWKATRTDLSSCLQQMGGDKNWSLFLS